MVTGRFYLDENNEPNIQKPLHQGETSLRKLSGQERETIGTMAANDGIKKTYDKQFAYIHQVRNEFFYYYGYG